MNTLTDARPDVAKSLSPYRPLSTLSSLETGIIGTGNEARALAVYLSQQGHSVHMLARSPQKLEFLGRDLRLKAKGKINGNFSIASCGCSIPEFTERSKFIFIATITTVYAEIAERLAPYINENHNIILFSSKLGGTLLFEETLKKAGVKKIPRVIETDALFACRIIQEENSIWIRGVKQWTLFSSATRSKTKENIEIMNCFFPWLSPALNVIQRGLTDFGAIAHATITLANMNLVSRKTPFRFYYDGMTEETIRLLEAVELEFRALTEAYGCELIAMKDLLDKYYVCNRDSLYSAMTSVPNYSHSLGPDSLQHRYLYEDICATLIPAQQLSKIAKVKTPIIESIVHIISVLVQRDLNAEGRTLAMFGFADKGYEQIFHYVNS
jgi:opine dehydrogenase